MPSRLIRISQSRNGLQPMQLAFHDGFINHSGLSARNGLPPPQACVLFIDDHMTTLTPTFWACSRNLRTRGPGSYLSFAPRAFIFWVSPPQGWLSETQSIPHSARKSSDFMSPATDCSE